MFENVINQITVKEIANDIRNNNFPGAVLFSGPTSSGKLTAALEVARIYSCKNEKKGSWSCECSSCMQNKALTCSNLLLMGPRDCILEILSAKQYFLNAVKNNSPFLVSARYFFIRSIRKLTLRFDGILLQGDASINKIGNLIGEINESLEVLDFPHNLPEYEKIEKECDNLENLCKKLSGKEYFYNSIPINQIRNMESWAHIKSDEGKKIIIIENAEKMTSAVRNALLKILEEPPQDCIFILLTSNRNAIMETILSRVRTYNFKQRNLTEQKEVIKKIFHNDNFDGTINDYLLSFLPIKPEKIKQQADYFFDEISKRKIPDVSAIVKNCEKFELKIEFLLFLNYIIQRQKKLCSTQNGSEASVKILNCIRICYDNVILYNQSVQAALEILVRDLSSINVLYMGVFKICDESVL